jgi:hypothetical protein
VFSTSFREEIETLEHLLIGAHCGVEALCKTTQQPHAPDSVLRAFSSGGVGFASLFIIQQGLIGHRTERVMRDVRGASSKYYYCPTQNIKNGARTLKKVSGSRIWLKDIK